MAPTPEWTVCTECARVVFKAHVDLHGRCANCHPAINNDAWSDLGRPDDGTNWVSRVKVDHK